MPMSPRLLRPRASGLLDLKTISGLELWLSGDSGTYDATSGGSLVASDGSVARWEDRSGNGRHFTQSTENNRPTLRTGTNGRNGRPVLEFDGSTDSLVGDTTQYIKTTSAFHLFLILNVSSTAGSFPTIFASNVNSGNAWRIIHSTNASYSDVSFGSADNFGRYRFSTVNRGSWYQINLSYNGSGATTIGNYVARLSSASATLSASSSFGFDSGTSATIAGQINSGNLLKANVAEIAIWNKVLSSTELSGIEAYARKKWSVS